MSNEKKGTEVKIQMPKCAKLPRIPKLKIHKKSSGIRIRKLITPLLQHHCSSILKSAM